MEVPQGKHAWMIKIGEKGQFVIPKEARDMFDFQPGQTILVLADEINRATPRTQSALLECMEERQGTMDGVTRKRSLP